MVIDSKVELLKSDQDIVPLIRKIIKDPQQEDAFHLIDLGEIIHNHIHFQKKWPLVQPFYAIKCNNDPIILKVMAAIGVNFDCASKSELETILDLGVAPERIIFSHTVKSNRDLLYAEKHGIDLLVFDGMSELQKIRTLHPAAQLLIRMRCLPKNYDQKFGLKFGCCQRDEAPGLLTEAKKLGLNVVGVTFYVGTDCKDSEVFERIGKCAREVFDLASTIGFNMKVLNIGGGFPGNRDTFNDFADVVTGQLEERFGGGEDFSSTVQVIAEPGRYYVQTSSTLVCRILAKRHVPVSAANVTDDKIMYYVNDGIHNSFKFPPRVRPFPIEPPSTTIKSKDRPLIASTVWGQTCNSVDRITEGVLLPDLEVDSWIAFENMGAYSLVMGSNFNGFPMSAKKYFITQQNYQIYKSLVLKSL